MEQEDLFGNIVGVHSNQTQYKGLTKVHNGEFIFYPNFFAKSESDLFLENLRTNIDWKQESMNMYGKQVNFPRLTAWYGDNDKPYSFSGITLEPKTWTKELIEIKEKIEPLIKSSI
jgi:alkylated DNA repair dioxygenase AlkB